MKRICALLAVLGLSCTLPLTAQASPESDLKEFQGYFKKKFPEVKFDEYSNGLYALPEFKEYRAMWESYNEFPPFELGLENGKKMWETPFKNGKTFASCFKNGGKNIAQTYPYWDKAGKQVRTAEMDLVDCMRKNGETAMADGYLDLDRDDKKERVQLAELAAYFYTLSKGQRVKIDLSDPGAVAAYEEGKKSWWQRRGQLNFACASCHLENAGKDLGGAQPLSAALGHPVGWPAQRLQWGRLETIHYRYMSCNEQVRAKPFKHGSAIYNNLQLYETYMSSGLPLSAPAMRN